MASANASPREQAVRNADLTLRIDLTASGVAGSLIADDDVVGTFRSWVELLALLDRELDALYPGDRGQSAGVAPES